MKKISYLLKNIGLAVLFGLGIYTIFAILLVSCCICKGYPLTWIL